MIVNGLGGIQFGWKEPGDREARIRFVHQP